MSIPGDKRGDQKLHFITKRSKCWYGDQYDPRERKHNDAGVGRDNCSHNILVLKKKKNKGMG